MKEVIYTWACTGLNPTIWSLGSLEQVGIDSYHIIDAVGCVIRQLDGSWNWYTFDKWKKHNGNAPSRKEAIRQASIDLDINGYLIYPFKADVIATSTLPLSGLKNNPSLFETDG
jgi:hypothetical protein